MDLIPKEAILHFANRVARLKMFPYFSIADFIIMCSMVREDLASSAHPFSRRHPLATWLSSMLMCFAGSFLANFLLGEPVVTPFKRQEEFLIASIVWYFIFYSPFDICYRVCSFFPVHVVLALMKEIYRPHKIHAGVQHAAKSFPSSALIMVIIGTSKGAGAGIIRTVERLIRGVWTPSRNELLRPSFTAKACIMVAILFVIEKRTTWLSGYPHEIVFVAATGFFIYFKLSALFFGVTDPLAPFENVFAAFFLGGVWDSLSGAIQANKDRKAGDTKGTHSDEDQLDTKKEK